MNDPLELSLTAVGLTTKQAQVYLGLLQLGETTVAQLAQATNLKRPILYVIVDELVALGYASEIPHQKIRRLTAVDPARLYHQVAASVDNLKFFLPLLGTLRARGGPLPQIEVHNSVSAITAAYRHMEHSHMSRYLTSYTHMQKHFPDEVARWVRRGLDKKDTNESRHILADDAPGHRFAERFLNHPRHHFRFLPKTQHPAVDIAILQGVVAFTTFEPLALVVMHSDRLTETMALLFDALWSSVPPRKKP